MDSLALLGLVPKTHAKDAMIEERLHMRDTEIITANIEQTTTLIIQAINTSNLNSTTPPWNLVSDNFTMSNSSGLRATASSKSDFIAKYRQFATECPDFHIEIEAMHTRVYRKAGFAEVLLNAEESWWPRPGKRMARKSVTMLEYRKKGESWMLVRETSVNGLDAERTWGMGC